MIEADESAVNALEASHSVTPEAATLLSLMPHCAKLPRRQAAARIRVAGLASIFFSFSCSIRP
jgi:hypothetical protein